MGAYPEVGASPGHYSNNYMHILFVFKNFTIMIMILKVGWEFGLAGWDITGPL